MHKTSGDMSFVKLFSHTAVKIRKTVKSPKNTICDTCEENPRRYEFFDIFPHTDLIISKKVKSAKNTICDSCAQNSWKYELF